MFWFFALSLLNTKQTLVGKKNGGGEHRRQKQTKKHKAESTHKQKKCTAAHRSAAGPGESSALPTAALFGGDDDDDVDHISTPLSSTKNGDSHEEIGAANDENWNVSKPAPIIAVESPLAKPASVRPLHRSLDDELIALSWQNDDEPSVKIHQPQQQPQPQGWGTGPRRML